MADGSQVPNVDVTPYPPHNSVARRCSFCHNQGTPLERGGVRRYATNGAKPIGEVPYGLEHDVLAICEACANMFAAAFGFPTGAALKRAEAGREAAEAALAAIREELARRDAVARFQAAVVAGEVTSEVIDAILAAQVAVAEASHDEAGS